MKIAFYTLGCKVNQYDTEAMRELFEHAGWETVPFEEEADVYLINTCSVTQISDRKSRQMISKAHRRSPGAFLVVTGCYAQTEPEKTAALPGVGLVVGTDGRKEIVRTVEQALKGAVRESVPDIRRVRSFEEMGAVEDSRTRAVLKIQDGCSNFCSYCVIPYARGPIRSRSPESVESELVKLASNGFREVVLTGIHLASYGLDLKDRVIGLTDVLRIAERTDGIERVRLGSLEPGFCDEAFAKTASGLKKLCRQFHLSLQSGSDSVLKRMNRRYDTAGYEKAVSVLRRYMPDCAVTTDVIAGFVGETEEEHLETCAFVRKIGFARMHVFPYSRRKGTAADRMEGHLERSVKERRALELIAIGKEMEEAFVESLTGTEQTVLIEDDGTGYTGNYVRVRCAGREGDLVRVRITGRDRTLALGEVIP